MKRMMMIGLAVWMLAGAGCAPSSAFSPPPSLSTAAATKAPPAETPVFYNDLFLPASMEGTLKFSPASAVVRQRFVNLRRELLPEAGQGEQKAFAAGSTLVLNLFEDVSYTAVLDRLDFPSAEAVSWVGHVRGVEGSQVIFTISKDGTAAGNISLPSASYQVRFAGGGVYGIYQIDQAAFPPD